MIKKLALVCIITAGTMITATPVSFFTSLINKTYYTAGTACSLVFGQQDASSELITLAQDTRTAYGLPPAPAPVKYQQPIAGWTLPFSSFTWFGTTWVDKKEWEKMNPVQKEHKMIDEIGHEYLNHSFKLAGLAVATAGGLLLLNAYGINPLMQKAAGYGMPTLANSIMIKYVQAWIFGAGMSTAYVGSTNAICNKKIEILNKRIERDDQEIERSDQKIKRLEREIENNKKILEDIKLARHKINLERNTGQK